MVIKFSKTDGKYGCFSNFYLAPVEFDGMKFTNSEAAWQAQKCIIESTKKIFQTKNPSQAKSSGRRVKLRKDWEEVKYGLMVDVCYAKFTQNKDIKEILLSTGDNDIQENTTSWHDNIWGHCECPKCMNKPFQNLLGKALMEVREKIKEEEDNDGINEETRSRFGRSIN